MSIFGEMSDKAPENILVYGRAKIGKTTFALSASEFWPEDPFAERDEKIVLKDIVHLGWDNAAVNCLRNTGIVAQGIDMRGLGRTKGFDKVFGCIDPIKTTEIALKEIRKQGLPESTVYIHDTISQLDKIIALYWAQEPKFKEDPDKMSQIYFKNILNTHKWYYGMLGDLPGIHVHVCHEKYVSDGIKPSAEQKSKVQEIKQSNDSSAAMVSYAPDITGAAFRLYTGESTMNIPILKSKNGPMIHPRGTASHMGNSRYTRLVDNAEKPNLRALLRKVGAL